MDILFLLIPLSLILIFAIIYAIWWAVHSGQFEDIERYGADILYDDDRPMTTPEPASPPNPPLV